MPSEACGELRCAVGVGSAAGPPAADAGDSHTAVPRWRRYGQEPLRSPSDYAGVLVESWGRVAGDTRASVFPCGAYSGSRVDPLIVAHGMRAGRRMCIHGCDGWACRRACALAGHAILSSSPTTSSTKPASEAYTAACEYSACVVCVRSTSLHFTSKLTLNKAFSFISHHHYHNVQTIRAHGGNAATRDG